MRHLLITGERLASFVCVYMSSYLFLYISYPWKLTEKHMGSDLQISYCCCNVTQSNFINGITKNNSSSLVLYVLSDSTPYHHNLGF